MSRKIGEFNITEFVKYYLANDDAEDVDKLIANVKLNHGLISKILKCYESKYYDRFYDLLAKALDGIGACMCDLESAKYDCDDFYVIISNKNRKSIEIEYEKTILIIERYGWKINYFHIINKEVACSITYDELMGLIK